MQQTTVPADAQDVLALDVRVIIEYDAAAANARCSTDDGCAKTCASSCASKG